MNGLISKAPFSPKLKELLKDAGFSFTRDLAIRFYYDRCSNIKGIGKKRQQEIETYLKLEGWKCRPDGYERLYMAIFGRPDIDQIHSLMFRPPESDSLFANALDSRLTDGEWRVVTWYFGIGGERLSRAEIGEKYHASTEHIDRILKKALRKLRCSNICYVKYSWEELVLLHDSDQKELKRLRKRNNELEFQTRVLSTNALLNT